MSNEKIIIANFKSRFEGNVLEGVIPVEYLSKEFLKREEIAPLITTSKKEKRFLKLRIVARKETGQYGQTHYLEVDQYRKEDSEAPAEAKTAKQKK